MIYLLMKLKFISEIDNDLEFELQCHINHGPQWNVAGILLILGVIKMCDFNNKIFPSTLAFLTDRLTFQFLISGISAA